MTNIIKFKRKKKPAVKIPLVPVSVFIKEGKIYVDIFDREIVMGTEQATKLGFVLMLAARAALLKKD